MIDRMWEEAGRSRPSSAPSLRCILAAASDGRGRTYTCTMIVWRRRINIYIADDDAMAVCSFLPRP